MARSLARCTLLLVALWSASPLSAATIDVSVSFFATPLVPAYSSVAIRLPFDAFGSGPLERFGARAWYLATSPYFLPSVYYEVGMELTYGFGQPGDPWFIVGVGAAFSEERDVISVPFAAEGAWKLQMGRWFAFQPSMMVLVYNNGLIAQADLGFSVTFNPGCLYLQLGLRGTAALEVISGGFAAQYGLVYSLGFKV